MFKTFTVAENLRGLLFQNGRLVRWLEPGKHRFLRLGATLEVEWLTIDDGYAELTPELARVLPPGAGELLAVGPDEVALVTIDGRPAKCLLAGRYVLWQLRAEVRAEVVSTKPLLSAITQPFWPLVPASHLVTVIVHPYERVLLHEDGRLSHLLAEGAYALHAYGRKVEPVRVDMRERELQIVGQDVMTADKVSIRINVIVKLKIVDAARSVEASVDVNSALYTEAQMVARRFVGGNTIDQLLEHRNDASETMRTALTPRAAEWGAEILALDIKDVVLPGEMKTILNRVIEAEKQAAANVILRREETAATRSLANTARLLESSPTLLRLKELETYKDMAGSIGQLTIVAAPQELLSGLKLPVNGA